MPGLPIEIPKCDRKIVRRIGDPDILRPLHKVRLRVSGHRDPGEIAFNIRSENRGSRARKPFRENLQGYGLAGAGGACDESMPVAERKSQILVNVAFADQNAAKFMREIVGHGGFLEPRREARIRGAPYIAIMRQCKIDAQQILERRRTP
jgi:hypothetical protein